MVEFRIGAMIRELRCKMKLSQCELAEGICSQSEISKIENGLISPYIHTLFLISRRLGIDFNEFYSCMSNKDEDLVSSYKKRILNAIASKRFNTARHLIGETRELKEFKHADEQQFLMWQEGKCFYYADGDPEKALLRCEEALKAAIKQPLAEQDIEILAWIGEVCSTAPRILGRCKTTLDRIRYVMDDKLYAWNYKLATQALYVMARFHFHIQLIQEALQYCNRGIAICRKHQTMMFLGELILLQGQCKQELGEFDEALQLYEQAVLFFEANEQPFHVHEARRKAEMLSKRRPLGLAE